MTRQTIILKFLAFLVAILLPIAAFGFVINGNFEGDVYQDGNDVIPINWVKVETFPDSNNIDETSHIFLVNDNGLSVSGENAVHFMRSDGGSSGDWTGISQDLDIDTNHFPALELWIDVKVIDHNLCGGGFAGAWEYPISAVIHYLDSNNITKNVQIGWYLDTNSTCDATHEWKWWESSNRWAKSKEIDPNLWYADSIDLKDPNLDIGYITGITVSGAGWDFEGRIDNVSIFSIVSIDIKPGSLTNSINLKSKGLLPVAILTTEDFDALMVDTNTVVFGDLKTGGTVSPVKIEQEDVNDDGEIDLLLFFKVPELVENEAINKNSNRAFLTGMTVDNIPIRGIDSIRIVPPIKTFGPPWILQSLDIPLWLQGSTNNGPSWLRTGRNAPWWSFQLFGNEVNEDNTNNKNVQKGYTGPPWFNNPENFIGGPSWFRNPLEGIGPWFWQAYNGFDVSDTAPSWYLDLPITEGASIWFLNLK